MVELRRPRGCGPRVYVLGLRLHHGTIGAALFTLGALLMAHDRRDWPWRILD